MTTEKKGVWTLEGRLVKEGYGADSEIPKDYLARIDQDPGWRKDIDDFLSAVPEELQLESGKITLAEATALDLGSGPGVIAERIQDKVKRVIAVDREENMTRHTKERLSKDGKIKVVQGDFLEIPLADDSVDLVLSAGTVWHIPIDKKGPNNRDLTPTQIEDMFLSESLRVLKQGGVYILDGVWNGRDSGVAKNFSRKREEEISLVRARNRTARKKTGTDLPLIYRKFIISSAGLEERLASLGYKCKVELPDCENKKNCIARITLLEKADS